MGQPWEMSIFQDDHVFFGRFPIWGRLIEFSFFSLYSFLLHIFSYNIAPHQFRYSYLSVSTHFHFPCSHYSIFLCLFIRMSETYQFGCTISVSLMSATPCSCFFCPDFLNPLYSHHPSKHSRKNTIQTNGQHPNKMRHTKRHTYIQTCARKSSFTYRTSVFP